MVHGIGREVGKNNMGATAKFTRQELESMRRYDRQCSQFGDYRLDGNEHYLAIKQLEHSGTIRYRPDAKEQIKKMGFTMAALARECGMSAGVISAYVRSGKVAASHVYALLQKTGKSFDYFFEVDHEKKSRNCDNRR